MVQYDIQIPSLASTCINSVKPKHSYLNYNIAIPLAQSNQSHRHRYLPHRSSVAPDGPRTGTEPQPGKAPSPLIHQFNTPFIDLHTYPNMGRYAHSTSRMAGTTPISFGKEKKLGKIVPLSRLKRKFKEKDIGWCATLDMQNGVDIYLLPHPTPLFHFLLSSHWDRPPFFTSIVTYGIVSATIDCAIQHFEEGRR